MPCCAALVRFVLFCLDFVSVFRVRRAFLFVLFLVLRCFALLCICFVFVLPCFSLLYLGLFVFCFILLCHVSVCVVVWRSSSNFFSSAPFSCSCLLSLPFLYVFACIDLRLRCFVVVCFVVCCVALMRFTLLCYVLRVLC